LLPFSALKLRLIDLEYSFHLFRKRFKKSDHRKLSIKRQAAPGLGAKPVNDL